MLFNSFDFAIFLPIVFVLYWFVFKNNRPGQNWLLLISSYIFYGWWDWRFLILIFFSSVVDYFVGLWLANETHERRRKFLLFASLTLNLGLLGIFKYYNFFLDNIQSLFSVFGHEISARSLNIILPVGISFYTFQTLSYTIDIYRRKHTPTRDFIAFAAFVSFFPQLVAGPIERASNLLPQFAAKRYFDYQKAVDGSRQILWGLFKKVVIADNCDVYVDMFFANPTEYSSSSLLLGLFFLAFQIYGDFSGYSDMAIGMARLFGFQLMRNFAYPYFSRSIGEFWRRWHISLSTWFRDYCYLPLGGPRGTMYQKCRNLILVFTICGFWHGATWTFIFWGFLNALFILPQVFHRKRRRYGKRIAPGRLFPDIQEFAAIVTTFSLTLFGWVFCRAENMAHAFGYLRSLVSLSFFSLPVFPDRGKALLILIILVIFIIIEWLGRDHEYGIESLNSHHSPTFRYIATISIMVIVIILGQFGKNAFIYFQF